MSARHVRLYKFGSHKVALLEFTPDAVRLLRVFDADAAVGLEGPLTAERQDRLRSLLANGYVLTNHDPDDGFFREAEVVSLDDVLKKVRVVSS